MGQSRPGVTLGHSLSTRRLMMVVRIGAFRPFRGMAVLSQLPDDHGITNAKVGVGTKLDDKRWVSDSAIFWLRWTTIGLHVWPDLPFRIQSTKNLLKPLSLLLANARGSPTTSHLRRAAACFPEKAAPIPSPLLDHPSMETPPSVTRRRPTGGMPVKPRPVCLLESSVSPCQQSLGFASCPSASPVRSSRELTQLR